MGELLDAESVRALFTELSDRHRGILITARSLLRA